MIDLSEMQGYFSEHKNKEMALTEFLDACKSDPFLYSSASERMIKAFGEPHYVDTSKDEVLGRLHMNRTVPIYEPFSEFYGMELVLEEVAKFFQNSAYGLEESRQILYFKGPPGGAKSSITTVLKRLLESQPIYVLKINGETSPVFESPLVLFSDPNLYAFAEKNYGIPRYKLEKLIMSPWATKRKVEFGDDFLSKCSVVQIYPSEQHGVGVARVEPGDENNQDVSTLVGKIDIRKLEFHSQSDTDAYNYSGGLNLSTQGLLEAVEMFKWPPKMLYPFLTALQDGMYMPSESLGALPYHGIIIAHSNEAEWQTFKSNRNNEAMLDRVCIVDVPYTLRKSEEIKIYQKLIRNSELGDAPIAPDTLESLAEFSILTRLKEHENSNLFSKMRVYNGEDLKDTDPKARSVREYRKEAGVDEGMDGTSTRFAFKVLAQTFLADQQNEVAADPVQLLMQVLPNAIVQERWSSEVEQEYLSFINGDILPRLHHRIGKVLRRAFVENYDDLGQNMFDRYVLFAGAWVAHTDGRDPDTGTFLDRDALDAELSLLEKPAGIANPSDFRGRIKVFDAEYRATHKGKKPSWRFDNEMRKAIEQRMFEDIGDNLIPVISFNKKPDDAQAKKHQGFIGRMAEIGYTDRQTRRMVEWYQRYKKSS